MTTLAQASTFNAEASLNAWMIAALQAFSLPEWLTATPTIVLNVPQTTAVMPCFSLVHIPIGTMSQFEGRWAGTSKGMLLGGMLYADCWVSRSASVDWVAQLRTMRDMITQTATASPVVVIYDYAALSGNPGGTAQATAYKININNVTLTATEPDVNPDVEHMRVIIDYSFVSRSN